MTRHNNSYFLTQGILNLLAKFIGNRRERAVRLLLLVFLLGQLCIFLGNRALCNRKNTKPLASLVALFHRHQYRIEIIRHLRQKDNIRTARNTCMQCQPANLMAHQLYNKYTAMGCRCCMNTINGIRCNIHCTLKTECHIRSVNIIVNSLWQRNNIQTFFAEQIRCLLSPIAAKNHKAVKLQIAISCLHRLNLVKAILTGHPHQLKGLSGRTQNRSTLCQDTGKIIRLHQNIVIIHQTSVALFKTKDLCIRIRVVQCLRNTTHRCIQSLTVAAACQHTYSHHSRHLLCLEYVLFSCYTI